MDYNRKVSDRATSAELASGGSYLASQMEELAKVVQAAPAWDVETITVTYRVNGGTLHTWASTYRKGRGWEALSEPLNALVEEMAAVLISREQNGWGQIDVDVVQGSASVALVQAEKEDVVTLA
jgi:hypothetical protein